MENPYRKLIANTMQRPRPRIEMGCIWILLSCTLWTFFEISALRQFPTFPFIKLGFSDTYIPPGVSDSYLVLDRLIQDSKDIGFWHPLIHNTTPYTSQFGFHGIVLASLHNLFPQDPITFALISAHAFCLITAFILGAFVADVYSKHGKIAAVVLLVLTGFSPWLSGFSLSLYWIFFLSISPFVFCWLAYPFVSKNRKLKIYYYLIVFILVFVKSLCGYEYITSVILACTVPVFYHHFRQANLQWKQLLLDSSLIVLCGIAAFIFALLLHIVQLDMLFGSGVEVIADRALKRTSLQLSPDHQQLIENFQQSQGNRLSWMPVSLLFGINSFFRYFDYPAFQIPLGLGHQADVITFSIGTCVLILLTIMVVTWFLRKRLTPSAQALVFATAFSLSSSLSWQILAFNHMSIHLHLNEIVFYIPFLLMFYMLLGALAEQAFKRIFSVKNQKSLLILAMTLFVILITTNFFKTVTTQLSVSTFFQSSAGEFGNFKERLEKSSLLTGYVDQLNVYDSPAPTSLVAVERSALASDFLPIQFLHISGWSLDTRHPSNRLEIVVKLDNATIYRGKTSESRIDVENLLGVTAAKPGFDIRIPLSSWQGLKLDLSKIRVYAVNVHEPLTIHELPLPAP